MRRLSHLLFCFLILALLLGGGLLSASTPAVAALIGNEGSLANAVKPYEINPDSSGMLWVSDYATGDVWGIDAETGETLKYYVGGNPSDARRVGDYFYWADGEANILGRSNLLGAGYTWNVSSASGFYGTAVDAQGRLWASDAALPDLYRLDPVQANLCHVTIPDGLWLGYLVYSDGYLWFSDENYLSNKARLLRLRVSDNHLDWWVLPLNSSPFGLTVDAEGDLWYANDGFPLGLVELDPESNSIKTYYLPKGNKPAMVAFHGGLIWFTEQGLDSFGMLDPSGIDRPPVSVSKGEANLACKNDPYHVNESVQVPLNEGQIQWDSASFPEIYADGVWNIYQMPEEEADPWGIAYQDDKIWVIDQGQQVIIRARLQASVRACKFFDLDKYLYTTNDRWPVSGWGMTLLTNGEPVETRLTDKDGCARWDDLDLGPAYSVEEAAQAGWEALTPTVCNPEPALKPGTIICDFINWTEPNRLFLPLILR